MRAHRRQIKHLAALWGSRVVVRRVSGRAGRYLDGSWWRVVAGQDVLGWGRSRRDALAEALAEVCVRRWAP